MPKQNRGHGSSPSRVLLLKDADVKALRRFGDADAYERLRSACKLYVRSRFGQGLSDEDCEDIVGGAVVDVFPLLRSSEAPLDELDHELSKALERYRKRAQRRNDRIVHTVKEVSVISHADYVIARRHFLGIAEAIESHMEDALAEISEHDQSLVIANYGLQDTESEEVKGRLSEAERKALWRALRRFNQRLKERLVSELSALEATSPQRPILEEALAIVRGGVGTVERALDVARDLEAEL